MISSLVTAANRDAIHWDETVSSNLLNDPQEFGFNSILFSEIPMQSVYVNVNVNVYSPLGFFRTNAKKQ